MTRSHRLLVAVTTCCVVPAGAPAGADLAKWDQAKAMTLALQPAMR